MTVMFYTVSHYIELWTRLMIEMYSRSLVRDDDDDYNGDGTTLGKVVANNEMNERDSYCSADYETKH